MLWVNVAIFWVVWTAGLTELTYVFQWARRRDVSRNLASRNSASSGNVLPSARSVVDAALTEPEESEAKQIVAAVKENGKLLGGIRGKDNLVRCVECGAAFYEDMASYERPHEQTCSRYVPAPTAVSRSVQTAHPLVKHLSVNSWEMLTYTTAGTPRVVCTECNSWYWADGRNVAGREPDDYHYSNCSHYKKPEVIEKQQSRRKPWESEFLPTLIKCSECKSVYKEGETPTHYVSCSHSDVPEPDPDPYPFPGSVVRAGLIDAAKISAGSITPARSDELW